MAKNINHQHLKKTRSTSPEHKLIISICTAGFTYVVIAPWFDNIILIMFHLVVVFFGVQHSQYSDEFRILFIKQTDDFMKRNEALYKTLLYPCFIGDWRGKRFLENQGEEVKFYGAINGVLVVFLILLWCGLCVNILGA